MKQILTSATRTQLTTVAIAREQLQILREAETDYLARAIAQATAEIEKWCNRRFAWQTLAERVVSDGGHEIMVTSRPVVSLEEVAYKGTVIDLETVLLSEPGTGILYRDAGFTATNQVDRFIFPSPNAYQLAKDWQVKYTAGFVCFPPYSEEEPETETVPDGVAALPDDVVRLAVDYVGILFDDRKRNLLRTSEGEGDQRATYRTKDDFLTERAWQWKFSE